ncbi:MAG: hypothetical protein ACR2P0_12410 [Acidimicrobiales bacterium]
MSTKQRLVISVVLTTGIGLLVLAGLFAGGSENDITVTGNPAIDELIPARESEILQRDQVGIDLAVGFEAALTIESGGQSTPVPADQLDTNQRALGRFLFRPGEDRVIEAFAPQSNCVIATYWPVEDRDDVRTIRWCFEVL